MSAERLEGRSRHTVSDVNFTVARTAADQQAGFVAHVLDKTDIAHRSVVHRQFDFLACVYENGTVKQV